MTIEEFQKLDLRIGKVIVAEKISNSEKLLRLEVDLGNEWRQIVSGIGDKYQPEDLINKLIAIVANLDSKIIYGIESQGMLLAAEDKNSKLALIIPDKEISPGTQIK